MITGGSLTREKLESRLGVSLLASPAFPGAPLSIETRTIEHGFGCLHVGRDASEEEFRQDWEDPFGVLDIHTLTRYYYAHRRFCERALQQGFLYHNGLAARLVRLRQDASLPSSILLELGTTSFFSYAASNFSGYSRASGLPRPDETGTVDLRLSQLANLCGIHCLVYSDKSAVLVHRGRTALFPSYISSTANGGISKRDREGRFDVWRSIAAEISDETAISVDPSKLRWLGAGISLPYHQPALYCILHTSLSPAEIVASLRNARDAHEIGRATTGRLANPRVVRLNLRPFVRFTQLSAGPWSFSIPTAIGINNFSRRARSLILAHEVHPHAKMLLLLFCEHTMSESAFAKLKQDIGL